MVRAKPVHQVLFRIVGLAGRAVEAGIRAGVDIAVVAAALDKILHEPLVLRVGGPDEEVDAGVHFLSHLTELDHDLVGMFLWSEAPGEGGLLDLAAVLVGAREEVDVVADLPVKTNGYVGRRGRVRMADVRHVVHVVDGSGDVEPAHGRAILTDGLTATLRRPGASGSQPA